MIECRYTFQSLQMKMQLKMIFLFCFIEISDKTSWQENLLVNVKEFGSSFFLHCLYVHMICVPLGGEAALGALCVPPPSINHPVAQRRSAQVC